MIQSQCSRVSRVQWTFSRLFSWAVALVSPRWAGASSCSAPAIPPYGRDSGRNGTGTEGTSFPKRAPTGPAPVNCPFSRKGGRGGRLHHSPGSNLTTKSQRIKVARRLFLKGKETNWLTAESQSRRSNISSDRNLWEEPGQGDRA